MNIHIERIASGVTLLTALIFVIFSIYLFGHLDENFRPVIALICAIVLITTDVLYRRLHTEKWMSKKNFAVIELLGSIQMSLNGIGSLGLYTETKYFDMLLHITGPVIVGIVLTLIFGSIMKNEKRFYKSRLQLYSLTTTGILVFVWEGWEWIGDALFGTSMLGQHGEPYDTLYDILGGIGSLSVLALINILLIKRAWKN